jgi:hypothetical protein
VNGARDTAHALAEKDRIEWGSIRMGVEGQGRYQHLNPKRVSHPFERNASLQIGADPLRFKRHFGG